MFELMTGRGNLEKISKVCSLLSLNLARVIQNRVLKAAEVINVKALTKEAIEMECGLNGASLR